MLWPQEHADELQYMHRSFKDALAQSVFPVVPVVLFENGQMVKASPRASLPVHTHTHGCRR